MSAPFSPRAALALVAGGALLFIALLWMVGAGLAGASVNDGGGHGGGRGLNGFAAFAKLLETQGHAVTLARSETELQRPGLLVLTPPAEATGKDIDRIVSAHRTIGPTVVISPKWIASPAPPGTVGARRGWVTLDGTRAPSWPGFLDDVQVTVTPLPASARWYANGTGGALPVPANVESGDGARLIPLVWTLGRGRMLAGYIDDGNYTLLDAWAQVPARRQPADPDNAASARYPLVLVFEPDLLDNYGMNDPANAALADSLVRNAGLGADQPVTFDLTLNGLARSNNLLTLAFTPPYLAATLCLMMAGLAAGWRAFLRFGAPRAPDRPIALGKQALVRNTAALIRRTGRLRLVAEPYADHAREAIARALALPRIADAATTEAAIDLILAKRFADAPRFADTAAALRRAGEGRRGDEAAMLRAAQTLHALERMLAP